MLTLAGYLVAGYGLLCLLLYLLQRQLIYFPVPAQLPSADPLILQQPLSYLFQRKYLIQNLQAGYNEKDISLLQGGEP